MRILLSTERRTDPPGWIVRLAVDGRDPGPERPVRAREADNRWWPQLPDGADHLSEVFQQQSGQLLTLGDTADPESAPSAEDRAKRARTYGEYLFRTCVDADRWDSLTRDHTGPIELAVHCAADDTDLHRLVWELMYDPARSSYLARDPQHPVSIVRTVSPAPSAADRSVLEISALPRVLHFATTRIANRVVRPGADVVGLLQGMQRTGGVVDARAAYDRSLADLRSIYQRFHPHVVHVVAAARWDADRRRAVVQMRLGHATAWAEVTADQLVDALTHRDRLPTVMLLSACETGSVDSGTPLELTASALAAEFVAAGVPIVVALTGAVSDIAYRLFVRVLGTGISKGRPVVEATARARVAAFGRPPGREPDAIGWALSQLFTSADLPEGYQPVTFNSRLRIRTQIRDLRLQEEPVLCYREAFLDALDELLDPRNASAVLLVQSRVQGAHAGGSRLLSGLAGTALRGGSVPCVVGPFETDAPQSAASLALYVVRAIVECRAALDLPIDFHSATLRIVDDAGPRDPAGPRQGAVDSLIDKLQEMVEQDTPAVDAADLAIGLRTDLVALIEAAAARGLLPRPYRSLPILLLDDVDRYGPDAQKLCAMLGTRGLLARQDGPANRLKIPVVLFAREHADGRGIGSTELAGRLTARLAHRSFQRRDLPLPRDLGTADGADHDVLVCQWMLLHPMAVPMPLLDVWKRPQAMAPTLVLTPRAGQEHSWEEKARTLLADSTRFYDEEVLATLERHGLEEGWFYADDDDEILRDLGLDDVDVT